LEEAQGPAIYNGAVIAILQQYDATSYHLARFAEQVTILVRGKTLASGMSDYLIKQIEASPNSEVRLTT